MSVDDVAQAHGLALENFRGRILIPGDEGYDAARELFNERVEGHPDVIAQCVGVADVRAALALARERDLAIAVRGGGHSVAGCSSNDGGLVIDLTPMRGVRVNPATATAWVGGGTRAIDLIVEAGQFGLVPVTGVSPKVGIAGLVMGLGEGYLTPKYGFGGDNVLAFELVTADGTVLQVSADEYTDLFWAMRGAGANFGVVTALKLRLHPLPPQTIGGWMMFGHRDVARVTNHLWHVMKTGSEHYFPFAVYELDADRKLRVRVLPAHIGPAELAQRELDPLRRCAAPISDDTRPMPYLDLVNEIGGPADDFLYLNRRRAWDLYRFDYDTSRERQMEVLLEQADALTPTSHIDLWRTVPIPAPTSASAAPRLPGIAFFLSSQWRDSADDEEQLRWMRNAAASLEASGVVTEAANGMNHVGVFEERRCRTLYGDSTYERLASLKAEYDPANCFRPNYNISPAR